jgi:hypothetical protein
MVCSFCFPFDLICFIAWLEVLIKWSFKFPYILINKLGKELERKSHTPTIIYYYENDVYACRFFSMKVKCY